MRLAIFIDIVVVIIRGLYNHGALVRAIVLLSVQEEVLLGASRHSCAQLGAHRGLGLRVRDHDLLASTVAVAACVARTRHDVLLRHLTIDRID